MCFQRSSDALARSGLLRQNGIRTTYQYLTGGTVGVSDILAQIDREIAQLQQARALLSGGHAASAKKAVAAPGVR